MRWVSGPGFGIPPSRVHYRCAGSDDIGHLTAAERTAVVDAKRHAKSHSDTPASPRLHRARHPRRRRRRARSASTPARVSETSDSWPSTSGRGRRPRRNYAEAADWVERRLTAWATGCAGPPSGCRPATRGACRFAAGTTVNVIAEPAGFDRSDRARRRRRPPGHRPAGPRRGGQRAPASPCCWSWPGWPRPSRREVPVQFIAFGAEEPRGSGRRAAPLRLPAARGRAVPGRARARSPAWCRWTGSASGPATSRSARADLTGPGLRTARPPGRRPGRHPHPGV